MARPKTYEALNISMQNISLDLSIKILAGMFILALFWRSFLPTYFAEKAKNLASKEDLARLTAIVESVKATHTGEIEKLKATLATEGQVLERRRRVYEEICTALRVFVSGHGNSDDAKHKFHDSYAAAWLWASDEAVSKLNEFIALQRQRYVNSSSVSQDELKAAYVNVVLAMRKDVGFPATAVPPDEYQFVQFA